MPGQEAPRRCAVVGAGVLGACLANQLAGAGVEVTLFDRGLPGQATTRSSLAWLNSNDKSPSAYHELNYAGMRAWARLAGTMDGDAWYRPVGNLEWAATGEEHDRLRSRVQRLAGSGYPARWMDRAQAVDLEPALRLPAGLDGVAWFAEESYLLTEPLVDRLVAGAVRHGATVLTGDQGQVTGIDPATRSVRTAAGTVVESDVVVCCAGRWTPEVVTLAGSTTRIPLVPWESPGATAPGLVVLAGPVTRQAPRRMVHAPDVHLRPHPDDLVHLEAPDAAVDLHTPEASLRRWAEELLRRARQVVCGLDEAKVVEYRVCVRPMPADGHSIAGWLPAVPGLYALVTHSGVTLGAHLARLVTEELTTGIPAVELAPYRPDRFPTPREWRAPF